MRLVCTQEPSVHTGTCTEGSAIADTRPCHRTQVLLHAPSTSTVHVLCVHAAWSMGHPSMGLPRGMEALDLDTFSCWTPLETLRLLARLAEISVSRALLPLWPLTTGSESEPLPPQLVIRADQYRPVPLCTSPEQRGAPTPPLCAPPRRITPPQQLLRTADLVTPPALSSH